MATKKGTPDNTYAAFFAAVLSDLGIHGQTAVNAQLGLADVVNEEGPNKYYNPFNIEWHPGDNPAYKGTGNYNSAGVQEYGSEQQGIDATVAFLTSNSRWQQLIDALGTGSKSKIDTAFTNIYTWADFHPGSTNTDKNILASKLGTKSTNVSPPNTGENIASGISGVIGGVTGTLDSVPKLIKWFSSTDNLIRIGFVVLGLFILLIGVDKLSGGGITGSANSTPTETVDVVVGNKPGNQRTVAGRAASAPAKVVKHTSAHAERGAKKSGTAAKSAPKRAVEDAGKAAAAE